MLYKTKTSIHEQPKTTVPETNYLKEAARTQTRNPNKKSLDSTRQRTEVFDRRTASYLKIAFVVYYLIITMY